MLFEIIEEQKRRDRQERKRQKALREDQKRRFEERREREWEQLSSARRRPETTAETSEDTATTSTKAIPATPDGSSKHANGAETSTSTKRAIHGSPCRSGGEGDGAMAPSQRRPDPSEPTQLNKTASTSKRSPRGPGTTKGPIPPPLATKKNAPVAAERSDPQLASETSKRAPQNLETQQHPAAQHPSHSQSDTTVSEDHPLSLAAVTPHRNESQPTKRTPTPPQRAEQDEPSGDSHAAPGTVEAKDESHSTPPIESGESSDPPLPSSEEAATAPHSHPAAVKHTDEVSQPHNDREGDPAEQRTHALKDGQLEQSPQLGDK